MEIEIMEGKDLDINPNKWEGRKILFMLIFALPCKVDQISPLIEISVKWASIT
uniref:Uncharacterized protein n=1 Tax=Rhizophora mucronata TaxID=61149 RepID=A0A2P2MZ38_RHIMU